MNVDIGEQQLTHIRSTVTGAWDPDTSMGRLETTETDLVITAADWRADIRSSGLSVKATAEEQIVSGTLQMDTRIFDDTLPSFDAVVSVSTAGNETAGRGHWICTLGAGRGAQATIFWKSSSVIRGAARYRALGLVAVATGSGSVATRACRCCGV